MRIGSVQNKISFGNGVKVNDPVKVYPMPSPSEISPESRRLISGLAAMAEDLIVRGEPGIVKNETGSQSARRIWATVTDTLAEFHEYKNPCKQQRAANTGLASEATKIAQECRVKPCGSVIETCTGLLQTGAKCFNRRI